MNYSIIGPCDFVAMPWRNGLGTTVELLQQELPTGTGFAWRLSMAEVVNNGEFSDFSGYDRILLLLEGNGLTLHSDGREQRLNKPLQAAQFRGEGPTYATLLNGPIRDFNVMTQRKYCSARVSSQPTTEPSRTEIDADIVLIYAVDAELRVESAAFGTAVVPAQHLLSAYHPTKQTLQCSGAGHIVAQISHLKTS